MNKIMAMIVMMTVGCEFTFNPEGRCFQGESYAENPGCPPPSVTPGTDASDSLVVPDTATDPETTATTDTTAPPSDADSTEGPDTTASEVDTPTHDPDTTDVTEGETQPTDSEDTGPDTTDTADAADTTDGTETTACVTDAECADDNNPCTTAQCDPSGECVHPSNSDSCNDNNACTANDVCSEGVCAGTDIACNDHNPCTTDSCDPTNGCVFTANTLACEDNNPCTTNDACFGGTCQGGPNVCACESTTDCAAYEDGNLCNGLLVCQVIDGVGNCVINESTVVVCDTLNDSDCLTMACTPATGLCALEPANDGNTCTDTDACTVLETCTNGLCSGLARACDDNNLCTGTESCDPATGCIAGTPLACDDGEACNGLETCVTLLGGCVPGQEKNCNDNDPCTLDTCNVVQDDCVHTANALECDDHNPCTFDVCIKGLGCVNQASPVLAGIPCNDNNACTTTDTCNETGMCVGSEPVVCATTTECHDTGTCDPLTGVCSDPVTDNGTPCNDGFGCTTDDVCVTGQCQGQPLVCKPDSCHLDATCHDTDGVGVCVQGKERCEPDGDDCTWDLCDLKVGCYNINTGSKPGFQIGWCGVKKQNLDDDYCVGNDADQDNDEVCEKPGNCLNCSNGYGDNAPQFYNPDQADTDNDGIGDVMDADADGDGVCDPTWPTLPYGNCGYSLPP